MDIAAIKDSPIGTLVPISGTDPDSGRQFDHMAFQPDPLPDQIELSPRTWATVIEAVSALSRLDQGGRQIPAPGLLRRPAIRREAQSTSALEGTYAAYTDLLEADLAQDAPRSAAVNELLNFVVVAERAFDWVPERPLTVGLLCRLQGMLVKGTPGELTDAGHVRDRQVVVGPRGGLIEQARYVPPPAGTWLEANVQELIDWIKRDSEIPPVVKAALAHYQFEALHPFSDGNGRLGRLMVVLQLVLDGVLRDPLLIVSPWFEARRRDYQDQLLELSQTGKFDAWVGFFCEGIRAQALSTMERVEDLLEQQRQIRRLVDEKKIRGVAVRIAEDLIETPMVRATYAAKQYGVSYQAANQGIKRLVNEGILEEITGRTYGRVFASQRILTILQA
ncbi:MAG: Fic family protein [bacterium]